MNTNTEWFEVSVEDGGVTISSPTDPLSYVRQSPEQVREMIAKLEAALATLEACAPDTRR